MSTKKSAGILLYKIKNNEPYFLLVHPGGPFWKNKDHHAWSIPKGEIENDEEAFSAALREFNEETGMKLNPEKSIPLHPVKQRGGKTVFAWAIEGDLDPNRIQSNTTQIKWPPGSNKTLEIPEIDKAGWFKAEEAKDKINPAQYALIEELESVLKQSNK